MLDSPLNRQSIRYFNLRLSAFFAERVETTQSGPRSRACSQIPKAREFDCGLMNRRLLCRHLAGLNGRALGKRLLGRERLIIFYICGPKPHVEGIRTRATGHEKNGIVRLAPRRRLRYRRSVNLPAVAVLARDLVYDGNDLRLEPRSVVVPEKIVFHIEATATCGVLDLPQCLVRHPALDVSEPVRRDDLNLGPLGLRT